MGEDEKSLEGIKTQNNLKMRENSTSSLPTNFFDSEVEIKVTNNKSSELLVHKSKENEKINEINSIKVKQNISTEDLDEDLENFLEDLDGLDEIVTESNEENVLEGNEDFTADINMKRGDLEDLYYGARLAKLITGLKQKKSKRKHEQNQKNKNSLHSESESETLVNTIVDSKLPPMKTPFTDEIERDGGNVKKSMKDKLEKNVLDHDDTDSQRKNDENDYSDKYGSNLVTSVVEEIIHKRKKPRISEKKKNKNKEGKKSKAKRIILDDDDDNDMDWRGI